MPRDPGNPEAIMAALSDADRERLDEHRGLLGLASRWWESPSVGLYWGVVAWLRRVEELTAGGIAKGLAEEYAADELGLSRKALESHCYRQRKATLDGASRREAREKIPAICRNAGPDEALPSTGTDDPRGAT